MPCPSIGNIPRCSGNILGCCPVQISSGYQDALHSRNDVKALDPFDVFADSSPTPLVETKRQRKECFFCRECCDSINLGLDGT